MEIKNLCYKNIIKDINYTFTHTKIYGVFSNSSKQITTFFELVRGLIKPTKGHINANEQKIYMLFNNSDDQIFNKKVRDEILYGLNDNEIALDEICERLNINENFLDRDIASLSSSERKIVAFATMLANNPDIILIDNFISGLDGQNQKMIINVLKRLQFDYNKQLIIADQNINMLFEIIDIAIILNDDLLISGSKYDIFKKTEILKSIGIDIPDYIQFSNLVLTKKNIDLGYRDRITDIIKDVYDNV